jgi:hypothetical protein
MDINYFARTNALHFPNSGPILPMKTYTQTSPATHRGYANLNAERFCT